MRQARRAGLAPEVAEQLAFHFHSHLDVFVNGKHVLVPAGLGIDIHDPAVHKFVDGPGPTGISWGGIVNDCSRPCISPLHTHDWTGILHNESSTGRASRLSQLFTEWGVRLDRRCVGGYCRPDSIEVYVNGKRNAGNPRDIELTDRKEIAIVIGSRPARIPSSFDFAGKI